jgi:hypothetical protein
LAAEIGAMATDIKNLPKQVQSQSCCCWFLMGWGGAGSTVPGFTMNLDSVSKVINVHPQFMFWHW